MNMGDMGDGSSCRVVKVWSSTDSRLPVTTLELDLATEDGRLRRHSLTRVARYCRSILHRPFSRLNLYNSAGKTQTVVPQLWVPRHDGASERIPSAVTFTRYDALPCF